MRGLIGRSHRIAPTVIALILVVALVMPVLADYPLLLFGEQSFNIGSPTAVTPTYGSELLSNTGMETGDPPTGWTPTNDSVLSSVADERTGGAGTQSLSVVKGATSGQGILTNVTGLTTGSFVRFTGWGKQVSGTGRYFEVIPQFAPAMYTTGSSASWVQEDRVGQLTGTTCSLRATMAGSAGQEARFDDVSLKVISLASMLGDAQTAFSSGTFTTAWATKPTNGNRVGLVICLNSTSSPTTLILASYDGTSAYLAKWVSGTYTSLIGATAATWSAGAELKLIKHGSSVELWYHDAQVSTTQTVTGMNGIYAAWFATSGSLVPTYFRGYQ